MTAPVLSLVIPCYNEERTLQSCVGRVLEIASADLGLEVIIVDDCSKDRSGEIADALAHHHPGVVKAYHHEVNRGKGAALHTGFRHATGDFVGVQDADLEYDPHDLLRLVEPLRNDVADVVFGSRFLSSGSHRVLYFWHSLGNRFLTLLSNMLTDLNLTDMETCYKLFKREIIQFLELHEEQFGFEPEVVAQVAQLRVRIYEIGISYFGRTYAEGKKIGIKDCFRALYCILRYNLPKAPLPIQFLFYLFVGGIAAAVNLSLFLIVYGAGLDVIPAAAVAFLTAAMVNYALSVALLFRKNARWASPLEYLFYAAVVAVMALFDAYATKALVLTGFTPLGAKTIATMVGLLFNFLGRKYLVFYEPVSPDWQPQGHNRAPSIRP